MTERLENTCGRLADRYDRWSRRKKMWLLVGAYTALFVLLTILTFSPFIAGRKGIMVGDGVDQHLPFLLYLGRAVRRVVLNMLKGDFSIPMFDLSLGMGNDIIGVMDPHGDTDPLMLLAAFVPTKYGEYTYAFLLFLRLYLAGLSFLYLCRAFHCQDWAALIGSIVYIFSGYALGVTPNHPYFLTPMITLPLLIVGTERVLRRERPYLLIFSSFYAACCSYYHFYMMTLLVVFYALVRFFGIYKRNRLKEFVCAVGRGVCGYGLGIGMAAVVLFPAAANYLQAARSSDHDAFQILYDAWSVIYRIMMLIKPAESTGLYGCAAICVFAVALLACTKGDRSLKGVMLVLFALFLTPLGNTIMNGFQYPSERWAFGLALGLAFVTAYEMPKLLDMSDRQRTVCVCLTFLYVFAVIFLKRFRTRRFVAVGAAFLLLTLLALLVGRDTSGKQKRRRGRNILRIALCTVLIAANVVADGLHIYAPDLGDFIHYYRPWGGNISVLQGETRELERELEPYLLGDPAGRGDGSLFCRNATALWQLPGMLEYNSLMLKSTWDFWKETEHADWCAFYFSIGVTGQQTIVDALLSGKYQVEPKNRADYVSYGYEQIAETEKGNLVYENQYALPWGYTYDVSVPYEQLEGLNGLEKQEAMLQAVALEGYSGVEEGYEFDFARAALPYEITYDGVAWEDGQLTVGKEQARMILSFSMPAGTECYVRMTGYDTGNRQYAAKVLQSGNVSRTLVAAAQNHIHYIGREDFLVNLGYSDQERTSLTITFPDVGTSRLEDIELYALPMDSYPERIEALRAEPLENIHWGTNSLTGTVDLSKDKILCVSVPYSKGWSATVDGEKAEILKGNYMFMCLPLTAGHHDIEFHYCSPGIRLGAVVTVCSTGVVAWMLLKDRKKRRAAGNGSSKEEKR